MLRPTIIMSTVALASVLSLSAFDAALAQGKKGAAPVCVNKAASGTNTTKDGAMFQAWEAVLQATDWGSWASFMTSSGKIGTAPGYKVSQVKSKCGTGGLGFNCKVQAKLCK